jgi:hypothetical protein
MDLALGYLEVCRGIKKALFTPAFTSENDFLDFFQRLPEPLNQLVHVNANTLRPQVGTKSKVLRIRAQGWVHESGHEITAVVDSGTLNYIYWKEAGFDATGRVNANARKGEASKAEAGSAGAERAPGTLSPEPRK